MTCRKLSGGLWLSGGLVLVLFCGCNRAKNEDYIPASAQARGALTAALDAWQRGEPAVAHRQTGPQVQFVDAQQLEKRKLTKYEIVGELPLNGMRRFEVKLYLEDAEQPVRANYIVLGIDPLWVFSQQDYELLAHWDHVMSAEKKEENETNDQ